MHFSHTNDSGGSKFVKIGIVAALHVAVGVALINNMNTRLVLDAEDRGRDRRCSCRRSSRRHHRRQSRRSRCQKVAPTPKPFVPPVEVEVPQQPQVEQVMETASVPDPAPPVPGPATTEVAPPANPAQRGAMRTAVLAEPTAAPRRSTRPAPPVTARPAP